ncbi:hypothetical protein WG66_000965 [Moniliophthora roreri]|nr:hypothetical protein WG66_000965 [Moniliophthora roreri]
MGWMTMDCTEEQYQLVDREIKLLEGSQRRRIVTFKRRDSIAAENEEKGQKDDRGSSKKERTGGAYRVDEIHKQPALSHLLEAITRIRTLLYSSELGPTQISMLPRSSRYTTRLDRLGTGTRSGKFDIWR